MPTNREIQTFLYQLRLALEENRVRFTEKAEDELDDLELSFSDARLHLAGLEIGDFVECLVPIRTGYDLLWIFAPYSGAGRLYIKLQRQRDGSLLVLYVLGFHDWGAR